MPPTNLADLARDTLATFERISARANDALATSRGVSAGALAVPGNFNGAGGAVNLNEITIKAREDYARLASEPAIARLRVVDEDDKEQIIYVARASTAPGLLPNIKVASYFAPMGRLAAVPVGKEVDISVPGGDRSYEVIERAKLTPTRSGSGWDSTDTVLELPQKKPSTFRSLRALLSATVAPPQLPRPDRAQSAPPPPGQARPAPTRSELRAPDGEELLASLLRGSEGRPNEMDGLRRSVIGKMALRDRPVLDSLQDEIFRLPLNSRLAIMGPPGTGKTTTLIKRLAQKVEWEYLTPEERRLVERSHAGKENHHRSWLVITPTELLRLYVKEAFANEKVAAPDSNIRTWDDIRLDLARNVFHILSSSTRPGAVMDERLDNLLPSTLVRQREWYETFVSWQRSAFLNDLREPVKLLAASRDPATVQIGARLSQMLAMSKPDQILPMLARLDTVADDASAAASNLRDEVIKSLRREFSQHLVNERSLLDDLLAFIQSLDDREPDETDDDPEIDETPQLLRATNREDAFNAYVAAMRALSAARVDNRRLSARSKNGRIADWLGNRIPTDARLLEIGKLHKQALALRRFSNPLKAYGDGLPGRYRRFRREQIALKAWYQRSDVGTDLHPLEVDLLLCNMMSYARALSADAALQQRAKARNLPLLQALDQSQFNQILIDEVADFSPLQIACMAKLCDPAISSVLAVGDLNQRITSWGSRSHGDLTWAFPDLKVRNVKITYRHSEQIQDFIEKLLSLSGVPQDKSQLPDLIDNKGVPPALLLSATGSTLSNWLAARIREIEQMVNTVRLPSIAILVNSESDVMPIAEAVDRDLRPFNLRCTGCKDGAVKGQESDVRVFDIQHIKGLEFEAVFFVGIDELASRSPDLFEKYLYVGSTRAAVYLGLTCSGSALPSRISPLGPHFVSKWSV